MENHKKELLNKSQMDREDFSALLKLILQKVIVIPNKELAPYKKEALEIMKYLDINDVIFIACALAYPGSMVWSDDKALKKQTKVRIANTSEMLKLP